MEIKVSVGEVLDKLSILSIKLEKIIDVDKLINIANEFQYLRSKVTEDMINSHLYKELCEVNLALWQIEDDIRDCERKGRFDYEFIRLARAVYHRNDHRAKIKKDLNIQYNSEFVEEKSYKQY